MEVAQEAPETVFLAEDEAGSYLQTTICRVWPPTGQTPVVRADPGRAKTNFYGALNLQTGQEIAIRSDLMNAEISAQYLELILEANPNVPILLLWDPAPWHRGKPIDKVLEGTSSFRDHVLSHRQPRFESAGTCLENGS
jgi:hypothetical protein